MAWGQPLDFLFQHHGKSYTPTKWAELLGVKIIDADGWRDRLPKHTAIGQGLYRCSKCGGTIDRTTLPPQPDGELGCGCKVVKFTDLCDLDDFMRRMRQCTIAPANECTHGLGPHCDICTHRQLEAMKQ